MSTNLLEKLDAVEMTADTRIDSADRNYCQVQQEAYNHARDALKDMIERGQKYTEEQIATLSRVESNVYSTYLGEFKVHEITKSLEESHKRFIDQVFNYFARRYSVDINSYYAKENLLPERPSGGIWDRDEEQWEEYHQTLYNLELTYQNVVDQIFLQLGGLSFEDRATKEVKDAAHRVAWDKRHGKQFEQKKAIVSLAGFGDCEGDSSKGFLVRLFESGKYILRAIVHFERGDATHIPFAIEHLFYNNFSGPYETAEVEVGMEKLKSIKFFKNNRVDFRFTSEGDARQFVEEYLGTAL